ncbi:MipA/OmpV family protein [Rhizobium sp. No.120]
MAESQYADAADQVTLPAPSYEVPMIPSLAGSWTIKIGADMAMQPTFPGAKSWSFAPSPILSIHKAGSPDGFSSPFDSPSITLFDFGRFQAGPAMKYDPGRSSSSDTALRGLRDVGATVEIGAFAQFFPTDWFRARVEVREGLGGHKGVTGEFSADGILPLTDRLTISGGPRFSIRSSAAEQPFFDVSSSESLRSGLPTYRVNGSTETVGLGGQISYKIDSRWEIHSSIEYGHMFGSAAGSPLIKQRGSADRLTIGVGLSYAFDLNVR